jgi:hypothetical protein
VLCMSGPITLKLCDGWLLSLGCAAWLGARDVLINALTIFDKPLSEAKSRLVENWCAEWCREQNVIQ